MDAFQKRLGGNRLTRSGLSRNPDARAINRAMDRIAKHRLPAARAALSLLPNGITIGPFQFKSIDKNISATAARLSEKGALARHSDTNNWLPQVWKPTFPVLHLALAFEQCAPKTFDALVREPWALAALQSSVVHLTGIHRYVANFDPATAVILLPLESDPTCDLFKSGRLSISNVT